MCRPEEMLRSHILFILSLHTEVEECMLLVKSIGKDHLEKCLSNVAILGLCHLSSFVLF